MSYHEAGATSDCEFSTINSVEPLDDYPSIKIGDYAYPNSIVRQLEKNLYSTIAFHGNVGNYFNRDVAYPKMGYQKLVDMTEMNLKDVGWGAPDSDVFKFAENRLKSEKEPFFAYTITMTSHGPFTNANNYYNNNNYDDVQDKTARDYMNSMSYVDQSIGNYVNYIRANFKNTYIFIWGDHTPNVNNNDYKQASFTDEGKYYEFVPLMIVTPDNKTYKENNIAASFLDVAPTIANASGMPYSINSDGIDLLNRSGDAPKIPFKGGIADRSYLFDKVSKIN
jgi:phosphoglycerol transferase MdoB-like AlkP superfamily enzyme